MTPRTLVLHYADEVGICALGQRLVLVGIAACIVDPAEESAHESHSCDGCAMGSSAGQLVTHPPAVPVKAPMHWRHWLSSFICNLQLFDLTISQWTQVHPGHSLPEPPTIA